MSKFDFESLHPSHKAAFVDGLLCGALIVCITKPLIKEVRDGRRYKRQLKRLHKQAATPLHNR